MDEADCEAGGDVTHHDGYGHTWTDDVALGTYTVDQALRACQAYVDAVSPGDACVSVGCGCGGLGDECTYNEAAGGGVRHVWFFAGTYVSNTTNDSCAYGAIWD